MTRTYLLLFLLISASSLHAQKEPKENAKSENTEEELVQSLIEYNSEDSIKTDSIVIPGYTKKVHHEQLDSLSKFDLELNKKMCPNTVKGYRVQIFSCSGSDCQEKAEKFYNQFVIAFPEIQAYRLWDPPSLKVRVGNCRNRFEAEAIKNQIQEDFPFLFIVSDFIESPFQVDCQDVE